MQSRQTFTKLSSVGSRVDIQIKEYGQKIVLMKVRIKTSRNILCVSKNRNRIFHRGSKIKRVDSLWGSCSVEKYTEFLYAHGLLHVFFILLLCPQVRNFLIDIVGHWYLLVSSCLSYDSCYCLTFPVTLKGPSFLMKIDLLFAFSVESFLSTLNLYVLVPLPIHVRFFTVFRVFLSSYFSFSLFYKLPPFISFQLQYRIPGLLVSFLKFS